MLHQGQVFSQCGIKIIPDTLNLSICAGDSVLISVTDTSTIFTGSFNWSPAAGLSATTGSSVWAKPGSITKYYVSKIGCSDSDSVTVNVNPLPACSITGNTSGCSGSLTQWCAPNGLAPYLWSTGATTKCINLNTAGTYTVTVTSAASCTSSCQNSLTVNPTPICSITGNSSDCSGTTTQWCAPASLNSYSWSSGATTQCVNVNSSGTYTVTVTDVNACTSSCQKIFNSNSLPTASIDGDTSLCKFSQDSITFSGYNGTAPYTFTYKIDNGNVQTISTNALDSTAYLFPNTSVPGTYHYILISVSDANGCTNAQPETLIVKVKQTVLAQFNGTNAVCQNDPAPLITFTGVNCTPPITFTYTINQNDTFTVTTTTNDTAIAAPTGIVDTYVYNLIGVTDLTCSNNQNKYVTIKVNSLPTATINGTSEVCQFDTPPLITFIGPGSGTPPYIFTYNINGGTSLTDTAGGSSISIGASTDSVGTFVYNLIAVSDGNGCSQLQTGSATVVIDSLPDATISGTASVCQNATSPYITLTGIKGKKPFDFTYIINGVTNTITTSAGNDTVNVPVPTNVAGTFTYYLASVADSNGCASAINQSTSIVINALPNASVIGSTSVCKNGSSPIVIFTGSNGIQDYSFTYNINGGVNQVITTTGSDTVSVIAPTGTAGIFNYILISVSDSIGCTQNQSGTATVTINELPGATLNGDTAVCQNDSPPVITFAGTNGTSPYSFTYVTNDGINPADTNTVSSNGSDSIKTITVPTNIPGNYSYQLIGIQDANGCIGTITDSVSITINPLPNATISGSTVICKNDPGPLITFTGLTGTKPFKFSYNINGGLTDSITVFNSNDTSIVVPTNQEGVYAYNISSVQDSNGCTQIVNGQIATITINSLPMATISGTTAVCENDTALPLITFTGATGTIPYTFIYTINGGANNTVVTTGNNIATVTAPTTAFGTFIYNLISVTDGNGCSQTQTGTATITVNTLPAASISGTATVCQNGTSPSITFTGSNGTPPYSFTYNINNGINSTITASGTNVSISPPTFAAGTFVYNLVAVTDANGCSTDSLTGNATIIVNPLPSDTIFVSVDSVCQNDPSPPLITIKGLNGTSPYTFTYNINGGTPLTATTTGSNDNVQVAVPTNVQPGIYNYNLTSVSDSNGCSLSQSGSVAITVLPLPVIQNNLPNLTLCNGDTLNILPFTSTVFNSVYNWIAINDIGFGLSGTGNIPNLPVINNDSTPLNSNISVHAISPFGCIGPVKSFNIDVNPKPTLLSLDTTICSNQLLNYTIIPSFYNNVTYGWNSNINPLIVSGNSSQNPSSDNIINDNLINHTSTLQNLPYSISLIYTNGVNTCITTDTVTVAIIPAPPKPYFTSAFPGDTITSGDTITLCAGSTNINFNIINPDTAVNYEWQANPSTGVNIGNGNNISANTVISFDITSGSPITIYAIADYIINAGTCQDTSFMIVNIINSGNGFDERKIIPKEPGHLLVYPDNSMDADSGYQWGYDNLFYKNNDTISGPPIDIPGQIYQFFIPSSQFIYHDSLNEHDYAYWVLLTKSECKSKVYYNGPYAHKSIPIETTDNVVGVDVYPNPSAGDLNISLHGNIYGNINAKIYNALGQTVYETRYEKKQAEINQVINLNKILDGIYMLELTSSDHQRITKRVIVSH